MIHVVNYLRKCPRSENLSPVFLLQKVSSYCVAVNEEQSFLGLPLTPVSEITPHNILQSSQHHQNSHHQQIQKQIGLFNRNRQKPNQDVMAKKQLTWIESAEVAYTRSVNRGLNKNPIEALGILQIHILYDFLFIIFPSFFAR